MTHTYDPNGAVKITAIEPSGLDTEEKWDATGLPVPRGPPTRVMDQLTVEETIVPPAPLLGNRHMPHVWSDGKDRPVVCRRCGTPYPDADSCP